MSHAENSIVINRPVNVVFDFVLDGENGPRWRESILDIKRMSDKPLGVGSAFKQGLRGPGGRRIEGDYEIVECKPNEWIKFQVTSGPARPTGTYHFEKADGGTRVTFTLHYDPKGIAMLMAPMITANMKEETGMLSKLKAYLESQPA